MTKKQIYMKAEMIYKYLLGDEDIETLIMCKPTEINIITTDQSLYEALGAIKDKNKINYNKLVKFLESVDVLSFKYDLKKDRTVLKDERVDEIIVKAKQKFEFDKTDHKEVKNARKEN